MKVCGLYSIGRFVACVVAVDLVVNIFIYFVGLAGVIEYDPVSAELSATISRPRIVHRGSGHTLEEHMKYTFTAVTLAGFAMAAGAQDFSLSIVAAGDPFSGTTMTLDVISDASAGTHMLGGGFALSIFENNSLINNITWQAASWSQFNTDDGYDAGSGDYNQVIFGQLVIPGVPPFDVPAPGSEIGGLIGSFVVELDRELNLFDQISFEFVAGSPFTLQVIDINTGESFESSQGNLALNGLYINIPAPSSLALLGLGGLAASRRRR